ncbi:hypothetical protein MJO28_002263 [Puccinia striiformis f. sp. tritici]|uniref:Uncharacterized protein n=3 Tax=Puccinia striiformis TaxID=27350 RepID=A0A2S4VTJ1_9BASI|nr:hypothetical protein MJO28_002263 [Puccinia striiformis f. sp. tritici]POW12809.1 hypothetical protein PSHT_07974 [Puccinia striiformis]
MFSYLSSGPLKCVTIHTGELKAVKSGYQEIKHQIHLLNQPPDRDFPFYQVKLRLQLLHRSLKTPIQHAMFQLSGVGSAFTSLQLNTDLQGPEHVSGTAPLILRADSIELSDAGFPMDEHLPGNGSRTGGRSASRFSFKMIEIIKNALQYLDQLRSYMTTRKEPTSLTSSILGRNAMRPTMVQGMTRGKNSPPGTLELSQAGTSAISPKIFENYADGGGTRSKGLASRGSVTTGGIEEAVVNENQHPSNSLHPAIGGSYSDDHALQETPSILLNLLHSNTVPNPAAEGFPSAETLLLSHGGATTSITTNLKNPLVGSKIQLGALAIDPSTSRGELHGDVLAVVKGYLAEGQIQIWNDVEDQLLAFSSRRMKPITREEGKFLLGLLQTMFLLGDYIYTYRLLPSEFIGKIKIFRLPHLSSIVELQAAAMFLNNRKFFNSAESMIPQMDFLTTGRSLQHLHRTMKAIPSQDHVHLVHSVLHEIFRITIFFSPPNVSSERFSEIRSELCQDRFFEVAQKFSLALSKAPDMKYRDEDENGSIVNLIDELIKFFQDPPRELLSDKERIEFQIIFYSLDFLDNYFQPIMVAMARRQMIPPLFRKQLDYMRSFLRFFQKQFQDPSVFRYLTQDQTFMKMHRDRDVENESLRQWIETVPLTLFRDIGWSDRFGIRRSPRFTIWMCKKL